MTKDTMGFVIRLRGELSVPSPGNEVIWNNGSNREFGGVVTTIEETDIGSDLEYNITAQSYERWLDRKLVVGFFNSMNGDALVKQIVSQFAVGFDTSNVMPGFLVPPFLFNYEPISTCLDKIAQQLEYGWYVDSYKSLHFFPLEEFASPLPNNTLNVDTDITNYSDLVLKNDGSQMKNRVYLKGYKSRVKNPITLQFTADGTSKSWNLGYKPSRSHGDITVKVGGTNMTIKRDIVDGAPDQNLTDTTSVFINYSQNLIRLNYAPAQGTIITATFYYLTPNIIMREDISSQEEAQTADGNSDGIYEHAYTEQSLSDATIDVATSRGDLILYKYAYPAMTGTFDSFLQGWRAGQYFYMNSSRRMGGLSNKKFYVQQVSKSIAKADNNGLLIVYQVQIADTPYLVS